MQKSTWRLFLGLCLSVQLVSFSALSQINTENPQVPFGSNTGYSYGIMPTNLPNSGTYGTSQDAADQYAYWKNEFVSSCSNGRYRVNFDNPSQTVSEGIAYGLIVAAYAGDKDLFDGLWHYYRDFMNENGVMHWRINGCNSIVGFNGAADAEVDAAMALIVAETQWPDATNPFDYAAEASELIDNVKIHEMHPNSHQLVNGDGWGFSSNCRNPSYQSPGYYKVYAQFNGDSYWVNSAVPAAYTLINNNVNTTTGLVSNWSDPSGAPNGCNGPNEYGYDACRNPWRMATDVIWWDDQDAAEICNDLASWSSGIGANNVGGPVSQNGTGGGVHNTTFVSTYAAGIMGASSSYQSHMNAMYTATVNVSDGAYFGETLKAIMLFMMTGNFWNPYDIVGGGGNCLSPELGEEQSLCGVNNFTLNSGLSSDGVKTFQWYRNEVPMGNPTTSATDLTISQEGTYRLVVDSLGECTKQDEVVITATLQTPNLGPDLDLCASPSEVLNASVSGNGLSYGWTRNGQSISGENGQTLEVTEEGTYEVTVSAQSCGSLSDAITITSSIPSTVNDTICTAGEQVILEIIGGGDYSWFASESSSNELTTGSNYSTTLSSTTTFWVAEESGITTTVGPSSAGTGPWNISDYSSEDKQLLIEPLTDLTLSSLDVNAVSGQNVTINVYNDGTNQLVKSVSQSVSSGQQTIAVDVALNSGTTYRIDAEGSTGQLFFKNQGSPSYPITESGVVTLTNTTNWNSSWSLFFNIEVSNGQTCARVPVTGVIDPSNSACVVSCTPPAPVTVQGGSSLELCEGEDVILTSNSQANTTTWDFSWYRGAYPGGTLVSGPLANVASSSLQVSSSDADQYILVVRDKSFPDDASCVVTTSVTISEIPLPTASITTGLAGLDYCEGTPGAVLTAQNAGLGASYLWTGPVSGSGPTLTDAVEGTYSLEVTRNGCVATSSNVNVNELTAPSLNSISGPSEVCNLGNETYAFSVSGDPVTSLTWELPVGASVINSGTSTVEVDFTGAENGPTTITAFGESADGCTSNSVFTFVEVGCVTSVFEVEGVELVVFPNPAHDFIEVQWPQTEGGEVFVELLDARGKSVLISETFDNQIRLATNELPSGMYSVRVVSDSGSSLIQVNVAP